MPKYESMITCDGSLNLYEPGSLKPALVRENYSRHYRQISNSREFFASLRAGPYAWPGGYDVMFVTSDGGLHCHACAHANARLVADSIWHGYRDGWHVEGLLCTNETDSECACDHCGGVVKEEYKED